MLSSASRAVRKSRTNLLSQCLKHALSRPLRHASDYITANMWEDKIIQPLNYLLLARCPLPRGLGDDNAGGSLE